MPPADGYWNDDVLLHAFTCPCNDEDTKFHSDLGNQIEGKSKPWCNERTNEQTNGRTNYKYKYSHYKYVSSCQCSRTY